MKRVMNLVGAIVGLVFDAIYTVIMLLGIALIFDMLSAAGAGGSALLAVVSLLIVVFGVVALALNAASIGAYNWSHEKYVKKRGLLIAAVIFNVLMALLLILSSTEIFAILVFVASLVAAVLIVVDMCLERGRVAKAEAAAQATEEAQPEAPQE